MDLNKVLMSNYYRIKMSSCKNVPIGYKMTGIVVAIIIANPVIYLTFIAVGLLSVTIIFSSSHDLETGCPTNMTMCSNYHCSSDTINFVVAGVDHTLCCGDLAIFVACNTASMV